MIAVVDCEGAPRDLGLDQGRHGRETLRADYGAASRRQRVLLRLRARRDPVRRIWRDLRRYFPGQAESIEAMARAARVPVAWFLERLAADAALGSPPGTRAIAIAGAATAGECALARSRTSDLIVRRSRPEGGFRSIDVTHPRCTAPLAGVNESGLAVASVSRAEPLGTTECAAPAALLTADCLARFERIDAAVEWLLVRPGGGASEILLAHAEGEVAGVRFEGGHREVLRPADGVYLFPRGDSQSSEVEKRLRQRSALAWADLGDCLGTPAVAVDPAGRRLRLLHPSQRDGGDRWLEV